MTRDKRVAGTTMAHFHFLEDSPEVGNFVGGRLRR